MNNRDRFVLVCMFHIIIIGIGVLLGEKVSIVWLDIISDTAEIIYDWGLFPMESRISYTNSVGAG